MEPEVCVSDLLRKALVVAKKLNITDMESWILNELNGYKSFDDFPDYRKASGEIKYYNNFHGWQPVIIPNNKISEALAQGTCGQSIAELEHMIVEPSKGMIYQELPKNIENQLIRGGCPSKPVRVLSYSDIIKIIHAVRNIILEWSLKLEQDGILGKGLSFTSKEKAKANQITYNITHFHAPVDQPLFQQSSDFPTQIVNKEVNNLSEIQEFIDSIIKSIKDLKLSDQYEKEIRADIETLKTQINSPNPQRNIINESLISLRRIIESVGSGIALEYLKNMPSMLP